MKRVVTLFAVLAATLALQTTPPLRPSLCTGRRRLALPRPARHARAQRRRAASVALAPGLLAGCGSGSGAGEDAAGARDGDPQLVLITCGGEFDTEARSYADNVVAFARPA
jgi:hypothetical protein